MRNKESQIDVAADLRGLESDFDLIAAQIVEVARHCHARGWALGTSGNFSMVTSREPLRLAITTSGLDKGRLTAAQVIEIDEAGRPLRGEGRPSAETNVHLTIARVRGAGAVLHTHSVWSTILSDGFASEGGVNIRGYEMLKGLEGVQTHEHREWLPIVCNTQDWVDGARLVERVLRQHPSAHGLLLQGHGLYTWGRDLAQAKRHVEILEFLLEVAGRAGTGSAPC